MSERVLVVVAHPDDETIGMGGTIAGHVEKGDMVLAMSFTDGISSREKVGENSARRLAAQAASVILGFTWIAMYEFRDNELDTYSLLSIVQKIEGIKESFQPTVIYTHSSSDLNIDHQIIARAVLTAFRPLPNEVWTELRSFEIPSSTDFCHGSVSREFRPNLYISIKETWEKKRRSLIAYDAEMREFPHSRSLEGIENLARYRGSQSGMDMAEAFDVVRKVVR